ncbi:hypothetical protein ABPG74_014187 [Tetrahymena malaccensis]
MEILEIRDSQEQIKTQEYANHNIFQDLKNGPRAGVFSLQYNQNNNSHINGRDGEDKEEEKQQNGSQNNSSDEDKQSDKELKLAIKFKQDKYRVEIRNKKNKQTLQTKRKAMMKQFQQHLQNIQGVRQKSEAQKENEFNSASEEFKQTKFENSIKELYESYQKKELDKLEETLEDIYILMRIDNKFVGNTNHIQFSYYLLEILKSEHSNSNSLIKCMQIICSIQDYFQLELNQPSILINVLNHQHFIQILSSLVSTSLSSSISVHNNILYTLYVFTERDSKFIDDIISEQIIEKCVKNFDISQQANFEEQFDDTTWIYLIAVYSNLAQHCKFPKHLNYFATNINLFINMLRLKIEDAQSEQIFKYQILKSLSFLMRKESNFVNVFNNENDYIQLIQEQAKKYSNNYLLFSEIIDIVSCVTSIDENENLIYRLIFNFQDTQQNVQDNTSEFFLLNAMISCLDEKVDINIDQKIYLTLLNTLLSGNQCLQKCKQFKLCNKLIKILQSEQNEQSYSTCLDVIRSYVILMDEIQDYKEIFEIANSTELLQNYFNQTNHFQKQTTLLQLCLLQHFLYAGDKIKQQQPLIYTDNPIKIILQKYHQLEYLNEFQYDSSKQIYQICQQIITQYIDDTLE